MGLIATVRQFFSKITGNVTYPMLVVNTGFDHRSVAWFSAPGEDAPPMPKDYVFIVESNRAGNYVALGAIDPLNSGVAQPGEKRIYSRRANGGVSVLLNLKPDGSLSIGNGTGVIEMGSDGTVTINGVTIAPDGLLTSPVDVQAAGVSLVTHPHPIAWTDPAGSGVSGVPIPS